MSDDPKKKIELGAELRNSVLGIVGLFNEYTQHGMTRSEAVYIIATMVAKEGVVLNPPEDTP